LNRTPETTVWRGERERRNDFFFFKEMLSRLAELTENRHEAGQMGPFFVLDMIASIFRCHDCINQHEARVRWVFVDRWEWTKIT